MANSKSSLVGIAQAVLDEEFQAYRVINADPSSGGATEVTAEAILVEVEEINAKTPALDAGNVPVEVKASVLPTGAATEATLLLVETAVDGLETFASEISTNTLATALATSSIDGKTPALGQALEAASVPVVLTAAQLTTLTPQTNALTDTQLRATPVPVSVSGVATEAKQDTGNTSLASIDTKLSSQATAANQSTEIARLETLILQTDAVETSLSNIDTSLNDIEAVMEVVGYGSAATAQRNAAMLGVGTAEVSDTNALPIKTLTTTSGSITSGQSVSFLTNGQSSAFVTLSGTTGSVTIRGSIDGVTYVTLPHYNFTLGSYSSAILSISATTSAVANIAGCGYVQVLASSLAGTLTVGISLGSGIAGYLGGTQILTSNFANFDLGGGAVGSNTLRVANTNESNTKLGRTPVNALVYTASALSTSFTAALPLESGTTLASQVNYISVFSATGTTLKLTWGGASPTVTNTIQIPPGGLDAFPVQIPSGSDIRLRSQSGTSDGEVTINFLS